jgi:macrolide-specific efflux system membrane fusion protein
MRKILIGLLILAVIIAGFFIIRKKAAKKSKKEQVITSEVTRGNIEVKVTSTGIIQPYTRVQVNSPVSGRIDRVLVDEGDAVRSGDILAWISSEDRIALLDAARSNLDAAQKSGDQIAIREALASQQIAENAYKPVPLTNSISGQVIARSCESGQNVTTQTVLFVISDRLVASVKVDEADIGKIFVGQDAVINLDAFPAENIPGKVTKIAHEGSLVSDVVVYNIMVEPRQVPPYWSSGMTANVSFEIINRKNVLTIPSSAVKERDGNKTVLVMVNNRPEPKQITTGASDGKSIEIISGLNEGEQVIAGNGTSGNRQNSPRNQRRFIPGIMH